MFCFAIAVSDEGFIFPLEFSLTTSNTQVALYKTVFTLNTRKLNSVIIKHHTKATNQYSRSDLTNEKTIKLMNPNPKSNMTKTHIDGCNDHPFPIYMR